MSEIYQPNCDCENKQEYHLCHFKLFVSLWWLFIPHDCVFCAWFSSLLVKVSPYLPGSYQAENATDGAASKQAQTQFVWSVYAEEGSGVRQGIKQKVY